jgi:hypothetical protein
MAGVQCASKPSHGCGAAKVDKCAKAGERLGEWCVCSSASPPFLDWQVGGLIVGVGIVSYGQQVAVCGVCYNQADTCCSYMATQQLARDGWTKSRLSTVMCWRLCLFVFAGQRRKLGRWMLQREMARAQDAMLALF